MADALYGWVNRIVTGSLTAGSSQALLPVANLQNPHGSADQGWQTAAGVRDPVPGAWMVCDAGASVTWRAFGLFRTNLTEQAQVRWFVSAAADFSTLAYDSGKISAGVVDGYNQHVHIAPSTVTGRYLRLWIYDEANPDGFINIPLAFAGPAAAPGFNFDYPSTFGIEEVTDEVVTRGGAEYPEFRFNRRRWNVEINTIEKAEVWSIIVPWWQASVGGNNVLFVPDSEADDVQRVSIFGRVKANSDISYPYETIDYRAWRANVTERL